MGSDESWQDRMMGHLIAGGFKLDTIEYSPDGFTCWVCDRFADEPMYSLVKGEVRLWCCTNHEVDQAVMRLG